MFSASRNCVQILATWGRALSCCNMRWWSWMNVTTMGLRISSRYLCAFKMASINAPVFVVHNIRLLIPKSPRHHGPLGPQRWHQQTDHPHDAIHAVSHLPCTLNSGSSVKRTPFQSARHHRMWAFAPSSRLRRRTAVRSRPRWGQWACRWTSLRRFMTVCVKILWLCKPIVAADVRVAGLRRSWRWRCWMWRSWAGVVTRGLQLWGRLDVLSNSLKRLWRRLMVEKWTFNSRTTALVDTPAVSMPIARSLKTCDICGIVLWNKTAHFRVAFYCGQPKAHLCQLMKNEGKNKSVEFIILVSVYKLDVKTMLTAKNYFRS